MQDSHVIADKTLQVSHSWDGVYRLHGNGVYKDRHWVWAIFPELFPLPPNAKKTSSVTTFACACGKTVLLEEAYVPEDAGTPGHYGCPSCGYVVPYHSSFQPQEGISSRGKIVALQQPSETALWLADLGAGVGNLCYPLLEKSKNFRVLASDYSAQSLSILRRRDRYDPTLIRTLVHDVTRPFPTHVVVQEDGWCVEAPDKRGECLLGRFAYATYFFVLSALFDISAISNAITNALTLLSDTGVLLIHDYATGDYREEKFSRRGPPDGVLELPQAEGNLFLARRYTRMGEETTAAFFNPEGLTSLCASIGTVIECTVRDHQRENRKIGARWAQRYVTVKLRHRKGDVPKGK
ncbi:Methyltransferase like 2 [Giardia muris]|uniref:Methyltransferase like 2 n=1 Tax=Giardia muris TaxID=5742 RepID=A0A4Z1T7J1_GIAMU|nr:Methyltransferase like 2 [Giardia muris]|eukprot:TNJ28539.1 Methyltransferase like 2 [Giardia muris]